MDDSTKNLIQSHIDTNEVCLFMKGTPDAPQCGFSMAVSNMLKILEVNYKGINVLESQSLSSAINMLIVIMMIGCLFEDPKAQLASENS
jgi:monothiol glutaredoxin